MNGFEYCQCQGVWDNLRPYKVTISHVVMSKFCS